MRINELQGNSPAAIKLENVGDVLTGKVIEAKVVKTTDLNTGHPKDVTILTLIVDGEERTLWLDKAGLRIAIQEAYTAAGITELEDGVISVKRLPDGPQPKAGRRAPHVFKAKVEKAELDDSSDPF